MRTNLVEKTQLLIKEMIKNKEYDRDNYLPSEGELCERFGVSRVTVREAVKSMEMRGFLRREHGKGLRVANNTVQVMTRFLQDMLSMDSSDTFELMEVRRIIEIEAAGLAARRAEEEDLERIRAALAAMENARAMDSDYYYNDFLFHLELVKATRNNLLATMVKAITPLLHNLVVAASQTDYIIEQRHHFHRNIFDSIVSRDPDGAAENMRIHLKANMDNFMHAYGNPKNGNGGEQ